jgi:pyruvate, water dikinase
LDAVRTVAELGLADADVAGGKGANLGELTRAGLPVPDGFVVTAQAYLAAVDEAGLAEHAVDGAGECRHR